MVAIKNLLLFAHRWLGVSLSLLFLVWFASGIGMMYWSYPAVTAADRLEHSNPIGPGAIRLSPLEAARKNGLPASSTIRLNTFDGRPVYRFGARSDAVVFADTGLRRGAIDDETLGRIAASWAGRSLNDANLIVLTDVDQWTIQVFRGAGPLRKYTWPSGDEVYVSERSGEVVQATTTASRLAAYLGPIPHWLYFTPLRKHSAVWSTVVIWSSGAATLTAVLGIAIGFSLYSPLKKYRQGGAPSRIPYRGQKRWHMVFGLIFGIAAATWAFSGMLSLDPFPISTSQSASSSSESPISLELTGPLPIEAFGGQHPADVLRRLGNLDVRELEWTSFAGEPVYLVTLAGGVTRVVAPDGPPESAIDAARIMDAVRQAVGVDAIADLRLLDEYDWYYRDRRRRLPLPVVLVTLNNAESRRFYVDAKTGRTVGTYSSRDWFDRWAYHALHSVDVPWLYNHRPAWDIIVLLFMLGGGVLSITAVVLGTQVIRRKFAKVRALPRGAHAPSVGEP